MITVACIEPLCETEDYTIHVDIDDNGWAYIKQGDDWVCLPVKSVQALIDALGKVWQ